MSTPKIIFIDDEEDIRKMGKLGGWRDTSGDAGFEGLPIEK